MIGSRNESGRLYRPRAWSLVVLVGVTVVLFAGCGNDDAASTAGGSSSGAERAGGDASGRRPGGQRGGDRGRAANKPPPPFEIGPTQPQPADGELPALALKPGHWFSSVQKMRANEGDFRGQLDTSVVDSRSRPAAIAHTPYSLESIRTVVLPKGQEKLIDTLFFAPLGDETIRVVSRISVSDLARTSPDQYRAMPGYQYYLVVLSPEPYRFTYLKILDSTRPLVEGYLGSSRTLYYQVIMPEVGATVSIPSEFLAWTSTAYVVWHDLEPGSLTQAQQQAILDWIHWGGQLIIDGPDSLDMLRGSFLDRYLPASSAGAREYVTEDLAPLDFAWTPEETSEAVPLSAISPWSGITLALREGGEFLPDTAELFAERGVGRGRIVVSAVRLTERELVNWRGFDSFFNACLLRRPRREYLNREFGDILTWADDHDGALDPKFTSSLRIFARDANRDTTPTKPTDTETPWGSMSNVWIPSGTGGTLPNNASGSSVPSFAKEGPPLKGMAGWNDTGAAAAAVRTAFDQAGGVTIPKASFVLTTLAVYLVVLVPINYLVFSALGRVEWAWAAAPVIAVAGTFAIVKMAQLDVGFVRAQTEVSLLEVQAGYPRGHLSRYAALYASLSTTYDLEFDDRDTVALPFPIRPDYPQLGGRSLSPLSYQRDATARLSGLRVSSNSVSIVHSEAMIELGGELRLAQPADGPPRVVNGTELPLVDVGVVRRREEWGGKIVIEGAWIGDLAAGGAAPIEFSSEATIETRFQEREDREVATNPKRLRLYALYRLAAAGEPLTPGTVRLVGRIDRDFTGMTIKPAASQRTSDALIVAQLAYPIRLAPRPDVNGPRDPREDWEPVAPDEQEEETEQPTP